MPKSRVYPEWIEVGSRISQVRLDQGLTQDDVRIATGVNLAKAETGRHRLDVFQLAGVATYLGVSLDYILTGVEPISEHVALKRENQSLRLKVTRLEMMLDTIAKYAKTGEIHERRKSRASLSELS